MKIHFVTHITTDEELAKLPGLAETLRLYFPDCLLHVFNQTLQPIAGSMVCENIKMMGFGWTTRFLAAILPIMEKDDLLIKVDPDVEIFGNPLLGQTFANGTSFGQIKSFSNGNAFMGAFQGFTYDSAKYVMEQGRQFENETGRQDIIAYRILVQQDRLFVSLGSVDLWADPDNFDIHLKVRSWKRQ